MQILFLLKNVMVNIYFVLKSINLVADFYGYRLFIHRNVFSKKVTPTVLHDPAT